MTLSVFLFFSVFIVCFCIALFRLIYGFARYWGVHFRRIDCPVCGRTLPFARKPTSAWQAKLGGWTCEECGAELDEMGVDFISLFEAARKQNEAIFLSAIKQVVGTPVEKVISDSD